MLVHEAQNLMITGKALSFDQDAFNYTRMSADVMTLAVAAGQIAAQTNDYWHADIKSIQMQMLRAGALIHQPAAETWYENPPQRIVAPLLCGEEAPFADVVLADWPEVLPILQNALAQETMKNREQIARALLWYGDTSCAEEILDAFIQLDQIAEEKPYDDHMPNGLIEAGVRTELDDYWRINQYAVLLAKCNYRRAVPAIAAAMNRTEMGAFYHPELPTYGSLRVDCLTNNHYDRMFSLAEAALLMPDERFVAPLWRLIGMVQSVCFETENPYMHFLTLRLAHAALKCGSLEAMNIIQDYQKNIHGVLREYASGLSSTLSEVTE